MKKTILIVLMVVMVATPCLAQEVETDGLFSIGGTLWEYTEDFVEMSQEDFFGNQVFELVGMSGSCFRWERTSYSDFMLVAFFECYESSYPRDRGIIFPLLGIGFFKRVSTFGAIEYTRNFTMRKLSDNWQPDSSCYDN